MRFIGCTGIRQFKKLTLQHFFSICVSFFIYLYHMINQSKSDIIQPQIAYTNSILTLDVPQLIFANQYLFQWTHHSNTKINDNFILARFDPTKPSKVSQFRCTPLDYGAIIVGRVFVIENNKFQIVKEVRFGPVAIQDAMYKHLFIQQRTQIKDNVKIVFNKKYSIKANICISVSSKTPEKISLSIGSEQLSLQINTNQNIRLPFNNTFFKFYDKEQDCLGISIYHQHEQFVEKMKKLKNAGHYGFYLKVKFESREKRDLFLFKVMENMGIQVKQKSNLKKQKESKKEEKAKEIDEQIFELLYESSMADNRDSEQLDMAQAQLLLASTKFIAIGQREKQNPQIQREKQMIEKWKKDKHQRLTKISEEQKYYRNESDSENERQNNISVINELEKKIQHLTNQVKLLIKENKQLFNQNKKLKNQNIILRFKQIKKTSQKCLKKVLSQVKSNDSLIKTMIKASPNHFKRHSIYSAKGVEKPLNDTVVLNNTTYPIKHVHTFHNEELDIKKSNINKLSSSSASVLLVGNFPPKYTDRNLTTFYPNKKNQQNRSFLVLPQAEQKTSFCFQSTTIDNKDNNFNLNLKATTKFPVPKNQTQKSRSFANKIPKSVSPPNSPSTKFGMNSTQTLIIGNFHN